MQQVPPYTNPAMSNQIMLVLPDTHKNATSVAVCSALSFGLLVAATVASVLYDKDGPNSDFRKTLMSFSIIGMLLSIVPAVVSVIVALRTEGKAAGTQMPYKDAKELIKVGEGLSIATYIFMAAAVSMAALAVMRIMYGNINGGKPSEPLLIILGVSLASMAFMGYPVYQFIVQDETTTKYWDGITNKAGV